jgi:hypothetical protein
MKTCCLMLLCASLAGCGSLTSTASRSNNAAVVPVSQRTNQYHARLIAEYSEGESQFLDIAPDTAAESP